MLIYLQMIETPQDRTKFEAIYHVYYPQMLALAKAILGNSRDAEDAVHEAFVKIIDHLEKISDVSCPQTKGYIVTIVENTAIDLYRRKRRRPASELDETYMGEHPGHADMVHASDQIKSAIASLPLKYREPLLLKYDMGYSTEEIAQLLSIKPEAVKKRLQRARAQLEEELKEVEV